MNHYPGIVPLLDNSTIFFDLVLFFSFGFRFSGFTLSMPIKTWVQPALAAKSTKSFGLLRQVDLHHKRDIDAFLAQLDDRFEGLAPELFAGKIVIGKEIERDTVIQ